MKSSQRASAIEGVEQLSYRLLRPRHGPATVDPVAVPAAKSAGRDKAVLTKLGKDPLHRALLDADHLGYLTHPHIGFAGNADQHLPMVRQEVPVRIPRGSRHCGIRPRA